MLRTLCRFYRLGLYWISRYVLWRCRHRPPRLFENGRPADKDFPPAAGLYFRFPPFPVDNFTDRLAAYIRYPDQSVNRGRYSHARDVLLPEANGADPREWIYWGVLRLRVADIPEQETTAGDVV